MADAAPPRDIHGEMDEVALGQVEEMAVELDAQASADAAREVENAFWDILRWLWLHIVCGKLNKDTCHKTSSS